MDSRKLALIKRLSVVLVIAMLFYMPTREFLKITFMLGIPFIFLLGYMIRQKKYSPMWIVSLIVIISMIGAYGYLLTQLPERIETRSIITEGGVLVAEERYDEAIEKYRQLEPIGQKSKMNEKIKEAEKEKEASVLLNQATELIKIGDKVQAKKILDSIPAGTRASREAGKLKKSIVD